MSKSVASKKDNSTLVRARFGPGMVLNHDDLEQLNLYTRDLSRLLFRSFFGCGVVCGLVVDTEAACGKVNLVVGAGLALDCMGAPVHVPKTVTFPLDENCGEDIADPLWVILCAASKCCAPRPATCSEDDDEAPMVCTRERDMFEIRVVSERPKCACGCPEPDNSANEGDDDEHGANPCWCADPNADCYRRHYQGECGCHCADSPDCCCGCILLARLNKTGDGEWAADHSVRRFIRPVLMRDPQVELERTARLKAKPAGGGEAAAGAAVKKVAVKKKS
jgi:hypothetical protein